MIFDVVQWQLLFSYSRFFSLKIACDIGCTAISAVGVLLVIISLRILLGILGFFIPPLLEIR